MKKRYHQLLLCISFIDNAKRRRISLRIEKLARELNIPPQSISDTALIEIAGNGEASIDGIKGVIEYTSELIKLDIGRKSVTFSGDGLVIWSYDGKSAVITGKIMRIEYAAIDR